MLTQADDFAYWRAAVAGDKPPMHVDDPQCGRYWMRKVRNGPRLPVAIWRDVEGNYGEPTKIVALVGFPPAAKLELAPDTIWNWCAEHAVSEQAYAAALKAGKWPDDLPAEALPPKPIPNAPVVTVTLPAGGNTLVTEVREAPAAATNAPVEDAEFASLRDQLASVKTLAANIKTVGSDDDAKMAQGYRARLLELGRQLDERRKVLKEPFLAGGKAVDNKWNPLVHDAEGSAADLRKLMAAWETKKDREYQEALSAANLQVLSIDDGAPPLPLEPTPVTSAPTKITGGYGKAASVRTVRVITAIDYAEVFTVFAANTDVQALLRKLAQKVIDAGGEVDGTTVEQQRDVR